MNTKGRAMRAFKAMELDELSRGQGKWTEEKVQSPVLSKEGTSKGTKKEEPMRLEVSNEKRVTSWPRDSFCPHSTLLSF